LPANYGLLIQRREFIEETVKIARKHGALVIFDEVISGFRVALGGMAEVLGMRPDLVTYGKVIAVVPGSVLWRPKRFDEVGRARRARLSAGTLSANPVGMRAAGDAAEIERVGAYAQLEERTGRFCDQLNAEMQQRGLPFELTRTASIFWLHAQTKAPIRRIGQIPEHHPTAFAKVFHAALSRGVYLAPSGFEVGFMSLAHDHDLLEKAGEAILAAVKRLRKNSLSLWERAGVRDLGPYAHAPLPNPLPKERGQETNEHWNQAQSNRHRSGRAVGCLHSDAGRLVVGVWSAST